MPVVGGLGILNLRAFEQDPLGFMERVAREYGDIARYRLGWMEFVQLSHPDLIEQVLVKQARQFIKSVTLRRGKILLGEGLLTSEGDLWLRQRRLMAPAFHRDRIAAYGREMVRYAEQTAGRWQAGEEREILAEMSHMTMAIVVRTLFGTELQAEVDEIGRAVDAAITEWMAMVYRLPFTDSWPLPSNLRFWKAIRRLEETIYELIPRRRESGEESWDLLSMLLKAHDEDGSAMTDKQLRDELVTLFGAGHETTAVTLTWIWYLLSTHPAVDEQLAAELGSVLGGRSPTVEDLPRLRFTEQVVLEAMRLYPAAWVTSREAVADVRVGDHLIRRGTTVMMPQWVLHRDPRFFPEPLRFDPDRWAGGVEKRLPTFAYFPFGGGPRVCIGRQFAHMEAILTLATIAQRYRLRLLDGHPVGLAPLITLRPKHGMRMRIEKR